MSGNCVWIGNLWDYLLQTPAPDFMEAKWISSARYSQKMGSIHIIIFILKGCKGFI